MTNPNVRISRSAFTKMWLDPNATTDEIAARFGVHRSTVTPIGQRFGLPPRKTGSKRNPTPHLFAEMWMAGVRGAEIAAHFKLSRNYLARVASNAGLPARKQGGRYSMSLNDFKQVHLAAQMAAAARIEQAAMINAEMADMRRDHRLVGARHARGMV